MTQILRQSTQVVVRIGPAVAVGDGFTPVTTLDLSTADEAEALKAAGAATVSIAAATFAAIAGADGWYDLTLTTSHTDTLGTFDIVINDDSLILPIFARFQIVEEAAFDAFYGSGASPATTTGAVGSVTGAVGSVTGAVGSVTGAVGSVASGGITATSIAADAIGASELAADALAEIADAVWDEIASGHVLSGSFGQALNIIRAGTAQAGAATSITLDAGASAVDDFYNHDIIFLTGGSGANQARIISDYDGATKVASVTAWGTNPSSSSVFVILPFGSIPGATAPTSAEVADAVWDETLSGHLGAGSTGEALNAAGGAGDPWVTALPGAYGAGSAGNIIGNNLNATVGSRATQTSVDDLPTNAELATSQAAADDATLAAIAAVAVFVDTEVASILAAVDTEVGAIKAKTDNLPTDPADESLLQAAIAAVQADTDNIQTRLPAALVAGRMDSSVGAMAANTLTASALATDARDEIADQVWDEIIAGHVAAGSTGEALSNAGGGSSPATIADAVWDELLAGHVVAGSTGQKLGALGSGGTFPAGAINFTYTVTNINTGLPMEGVEVWFSTDSPAVNIVWKGDTDTFGVARDVNGNLPALDVGTYFIWRQKSGFIFNDPDTELVS